MLLHAFQLLDKPIQGKAGEAFPTEFVCRALVPRTNLFVRVGFSRMIEPSSRQVNLVDRDFSPPEFPDVLELFCPWP